MIAELLELTPMFSTQEQEVSRKKKVLDNTTPPIENDVMVRKIISRLDNVNLCKCNIVQ